MIKIIKNHPKTKHLVLQCEDFVGIFSSMKFVDDGLKLFGDLDIWGMGIIKKDTIIHWYDYEIGMGIFSKNIPDGWEKYVS